MEIERVSKELYEQLMRRGLRGGTAGTVEPRGKDAGRARGSTRPATTSRGGGTAVEWEIEQAIHKAMKNGSGRVVRYEPFLMILDGGAE